MSQAPVSDMPSVGDPRRYGIGQRELLTMVSAIMALMAFGIDLLLPAFGEIRDRFDLGAESNRAAQVLTVFFLGLAVAQLVWGPLADRYGRKRVLYASIAVYIASNAVAAVAPTFELLLAARFVSGVGAAGARVVATAIVRDVFEGERMAKAMSQIMAVFVMAPVFAPSIGAGLIAILPWQSIFWFCVVWAALIAMWSLRLGETLAPENQRPLEFRSVTSGFATVARTRLTATYTLSTMFLQATFTAYLGSSERIISEIFHRGDQFPVIFGAVAILFGVGAIVNGQVVGIFGLDQVIRTMLAAVLAMSTALLVVAITTGGQPSFWVFMPMLGLLLSFFMFLMPNLNTRALEPMGELAGTASSLTGAARIAGGAVLGAIVDAQIGDSVTPFAIATVIFAVGAAVSAAAAVTPMRPDHEQRRASVA